MKYHFVINGYAPDIMLQMQEMNGFKQESFIGVEEGEALIYGGNKQQMIEMKVGFVSEVVFLIGNKQYVPETILCLLEEHLIEDDIYIFGSDYSGTELSVRLAARTKGSSVTAVHKLDAHKRVTVKKRVYSNHMEGSFWMKKGPFCISLAKGLEKIELENNPYEVLSIHASKKTAHFIMDNQVQTEQKTNNLEQATLVVVVGRGVQGVDGVEKLKKVAKTLGGCLGVSRPVAMNAWAPMSDLIGVSGLMIHPDICIVAGASGAAAFYAGIEKSKCIIAINPDETAPIVKQADVVVLEDYNEIAEALLQIMKQEIER